MMPLIISLATIFCLANVLSIGACMVPFVASHRHFGGISKADAAMIFGVPVACVTFAVIATLLILGGLYAFGLIITDSLQHMHVR